jgi:hypothetical protein
VSEQTKTYELKLTHGEMLAIIYSLEDIIAEYAAMPLDIEKSVLAKLKDIVYESRAR